MIFNAQTTTNQKVWFITGAVVHIILVLVYSWGLIKVL